MATPADDSYFSAAQSRRFACDRCHRHKLRCERSPMIVNGGVAVPLGTCKRCMKAQVACRTTAGGSVSNTSGCSKRKVSPNDTENTNEGISITVSTAPFSSTTTEPISYAASPDGGLMFSTDAASLLDLDTSDFGTSDFTGLDTTASPTSTLVPPSNTRSGFDDHIPVNDAQNTSSSVLETQYEGFVDITLFGAATPRPEGSASTVSSHSLFSHTTSSAPISRPDSPSSTRDDCRARLLELHSIIFNDLHCITEVDLTDALFSTDCTNLPTPDGACRGDSVVQRVLFASEQLIELLGMLRIAFAGQTAHRGRASTALTKASPVSSRFSKHSSISSPKSLLRQSLRPSLPNVPAGGSDTSSPPSTSTIPSSVDLPLIISFLTCYVGLLAVYRAILTHILLSLRSSEPTHAHHRNHPPLLRPRSRVGSSSPRSISSRATVLGASGPLGGPQHVLGMRIQMEVLTHMLERMEDAWVAAMMDEGGSEDERHHHHSHHHHHEMGGQAGDMLFGRAETMELLRNMLVHEGFECADERWKAGVGSLVELLKGIRRSLRSSNFV